MRCIWCKYYIWCRLCNYSMWCLWCNYNIWCWWYKYNIWCGWCKYYVCSAAKQKIKPRNLKIRLLSDHIFTKNQTKSKPKLAILRSKSDLFPKLNYDIWQTNFYLQIFHIEEFFKYFLLYVESWKSENHFLDFLSKKLDFSGKEDQFRSIFSKKSAIRPRSDKADQLGSTGMVLVVKIT